MEVPESPPKPTPGPSAGSGQALNGPPSLRNKVQQRRMQKLKRFSVVSPTLSKIRKEWGSHFWGEGERIKSKGGPAVVYQHVVPFLGVRTFTKSSHVPSNSRRRKPKPCKSLRLICKVSVYASGYYSAHDWTW